jgi:adenylate cyclase
LRAPNYKALAMNTFESHFVSGLPSQEIADKAAVENCESTKRRPTTETALAEVEYRCDLFASGAVVVTQRTNIAMPPMPWVDASVQRPFLAAELPMASQETKDATERRYGRSPRSKAIVIAPNGRLFLTSAESGPEEAMRRSLERCGYVSKAACLVVALDDTFVIAVPTLAKAVGFYRQDALFGMPTEERAEIARQLAASNNGWQAVALGAAHHVGTEVGAVSERSAVDGALENCAFHDHDCRIAVIGPFLVQPALDLVPAPPRLALPDPAASSALQVDPALLPSYAPPAAAPPIAATPTPSASNASPPAAAAPSVPAASSASSVRPAFRPPPEVHTTKQTTLER